jgi:hypothetical protein
MNRLQPAGPMNSGAIRWMKRATCVDGRHKQGAPVNSIKQASLQSGFSAADT